MSRGSRISKTRTTALFPSTYAPLLADLKARVRAAQVKAAVSVNRELILLYWHIGREILRAQKAEGWGAKVVERLAKDLAAEFPEMGGFSRANLLFMRSFYAAWEPIEIVQQPVSKLADGIVSQAVTQLPKAKMQQPVAQIVSQPVRQFEDAPPEPLALLPWSTNLILLHKLKDSATRLWYARKTLEHGWSRAVLTVQIESRLHERSGKAITNFERTLPPAQSDMAQEVLKDPYTFDFLTLGEAAHERDLERALVEHVQQLLLEMGAGFAFVGRQVHVEVGDEDFYLDLLFYHLRLRCFVVVDLKMKAFEPEPSGARQTAIGSPKGERGGAHQFAGKIHPVRYPPQHLSGPYPRFISRSELLPLGGGRPDAPRTRRAHYRAAAVQGREEQGEGGVCAARREEAHRRRRMADASRGIAAKESAWLAAHDCGH